MARVVTWWAGEREGGAGDQRHECRARAGNAGSGAAGIAPLNGKPFKAHEKVHVGLVSNPLDRDRAGAAEVAAGFDAKGSWLQMSDGLPLKQISTTAESEVGGHGPRRAGRAAGIFQSDGTTIEEFLITKASDMMAFDCGGFDFAGPGKP